MPFDKFVDIETTNKERRKAIAKSIRVISIEELKKRSFMTPMSPGGIRFSG